MFIRKNNFTVFAGLLVALAVGLIVQFSQNTTAQAVSAKSILKAESSSYNSVTLTWSVQSKATSYKLYRSTKKTTGFKHIKTTKKRVFIDQKLKTGTNYYYKVVSYRGSTKIYTSASLVVKPSLKAPRLSGTSKTAGATKLSWQRVSGATGYRVYRLSGDAYKHIATTKALSYTNKNLSDGKIYTYKIKAYRSVSGKVVVGPASNKTSLTTLTTIERYGIMVSSTNVTLGGKSARSVAIDMWYKSNKDSNTLQFSRNANSGYTWDLAFNGVTVSESQSAGTAPMKRRTIIIEQTDPDVSGSTTIYAKLDYGTPPVPIKITWSPYLNFTLEETGYDREEDAVNVTHTLSFRINPNQTFETIKPKLNFRLANIDWRSTVIEKCLPELSVMSIDVDYDGGRDFSLSCTVPKEHCSKPCPMQSTVVIAIDREVIDSQGYVTYFQGVVRDGILYPSTDLNNYPRLRYDIREFTTYL